MEIQRLRKFEMDRFCPSEMGEPEHHVKNEFSMMVNSLALPEMLVEIDVEAVESN